jgi:hypothetical protein
VAQLENSGSTASTSANTQPIGVRSIRDPEQVRDTSESISNAGMTPSQVHSSPTTVLMASLQSRNKNKRKLSRGMLTAPGIGKIVFGALGEDKLNEDTTLPEIVSNVRVPSPSTPSPAMAANLPRFITPSEKQEQGMLPSHVFVTSFHCNDAIRQKGGMRKRKQLDDW